MDFYTAWEDESCWGQWEDFDDYCEWTCEGWEVCDNVWEEFYSQDIDWSNPDMVDSKCISHIDYMSDDCFEQWSTTYQQCYMEGEYEAMPYMWTDMCDAMIAMQEAHEIFDWAHGNYELALNRLHNMKKNSPPKYQAIQLMIKPATPSAKPKSGYSTTTKVAFGASMVGLIAVAALARKCRNKDKFNEDFLYQKA